MPQTPEQHLESLKTWRDNLVTALATPETTSAFGGMPDNNAAESIRRMGGRAQLLAELALVKEQIADAESNEPLIIESRGVT